MFTRQVTRRQVIDALRGYLEALHPDDLAGTWNGLINHQLDWIPKTPDLLVKIEPSRFFVLHYSMYGKDFENVPMPEHEYRSYMESLRKKYPVGNPHLSVSYIEWMTDEEIERLPLMFFVDD